jgi:hypothetical protein
MKFFFFLTSLVLSLSIFGQLPKVQTLKQTNPRTQEVYVFPKIIIPNSVSATQKLNNQLRATALGLDENTTDTNIFDDVWPTENQVGTVSDLSFKISDMSSSLISLSISGQGCGAYCETFTYYFTFDAKTGDQLTLDSLFTSEALPTILRYLNDYKMEQIRIKLKQIADSLALPITRSLEDSTYYAEMRSLYIECLEKQIEMTDIPYIQFLSKGDSLKIYMERCSAHYNMVYDEIWTFEFIISLKKSAEYLTKFGLGLIEK